MKPSYSRFLFLAASLSLLFAGPAAALKDENNQGRWEKPCARGPDAVVPGFLVNMGPTGARGILKANSYVVKYIFDGSPAAGVLKIDDEVTGANGKAFGTHIFGGRHHGLEGPLQDLGLAIEDSEGGDGVLRLTVNRGGQVMTVNVQLEKLGRFAETFPLNCAKTKVLRDRAYKYLMDHPGGVSSQGRCAAALAMMGADDPKVAAAGKRMALDWNQPYDKQTWSWHLGFQAITLANYHLLTGDDSVKETLKSTLELLRYSQWTGDIKHWKVSQFKKPVEQSVLDRHQALYAGGFGHAPFPVIVARGGGGYGPMQWPTCLALMSWELGKECGLDGYGEGIDEAFKFLENGTTKAGRIAYGGEFTLNNGPVDTAKWQANTNPGFSAKSGLGYFVYRFSDRANAGEMMKLHLSNIDRAYKDMADGHACALMGFTWGLAGTFASDDEALKKKVFDHYKAWINLARCHGNDSYVILPARDYADSSYYRDNIRNHTTAAMALLYSFSSPKLRIHGVRGATKRG
jgi:hypothetical protein